MPAAIPPLILAPMHQKSAQVPHAPVSLGPESCSPACQNSLVAKGGQEGKLNPAERIDVQIPHPTTNTLKGKSLSLPIVSPVFSITITFNYFSSKVYNIFFPLLCCCFSACPSGKGHWASTFLLCNEL